MKPDCETCNAKHNCSAFVDPGTLLCAMNRARAGGTHADARPSIVPIPDSLSESLSCAGCQDIGKEGNQYPCCNCIRYRKVDHYMPKPDDEK